MAWESGDIVQITDATHHWYPALIIVTEDKGWGLMGYTLVVSNTDEPNGRAYIRLKNEEVEATGAKAILVAA